MKWVVYHQRIFFEGLLSAGVPLSELIMLSRSYWIGSALQNSIVWSGDISSTFEELQTQIRTAQNAAMSGLYWWTTDIGGYNSGDNNSPVFQELQLRWFQFGSFCPIFRVHGHRSPSPPDNQCGSTGGPIEPAVWTYANQIRDIILLRQSIRTYVNECLTIASVNGTPILRPMIYDCSDDACANATDQYMFGDNLVVAPIQYYQATNRSVYLPSGQIWTHFFSGMTYKGGQSYTIAASLDDFPLFVNNDQLYMQFRNEYDRLRSIGQQQTIDDAVSAMMG